MKSLYFYKCCQMIEGLSIRRHKIREMEEQFVMMMTEFKKKILIYYKTEIMDPLVKAKANDILQLKKRSDFQSLLMIQTQDMDTQFNTVIEEVFDEKDSNEVSMMKDLDRKLDCADSILCRIFEQSIEGQLEFDPELQPTTSPNSEKTLQKIKKLNYYLLGRRGRDI